MVLGSPGGAVAPFAPYWLRHWSDTTWQSVDERRSIKIKNNFRLTTKITYNSRPSIKQRFQRHHRRLQEVHARLLHTGQRSINSGWSDMFSSTLEFWRDVTIQSRPITHTSSPVITAIHAWCHNAIIAYVIASHQSLRDVTIQSSLTRQSSQPQPPHFWQKVSPPESSQIMASVDK